MINLDYIIGVDREHAEKHNKCMERGSIKQVYILHMPTPHACVLLPLTHRSICVVQNWVVDSAVNRFNGGESIPTKIIECAERSQDFNSII